MPDAIRKLLAANGGLPQPGILWPRSRWRAAFPDVSLFERLPDRLDRGTVRTACEAAAASKDDARDAFLAAMAWGYGEVGYGPWRIKVALEDADAGKKLLAVATTLEHAGPLAAYELMANASRLPRVGPAFGSKFLFFADQRNHQHHALILDRLVAQWLSEHTQFDPNPVPWAPRTYGRYLERMHEWASAHGVQPEALEHAMFAAMTPPTSQWSTNRPTG